MIESLISRLNSKYKYTYSCSEIMFVQLNWQISIRVVAFICIFWAFILQQQQQYWDAVHIGANFLEKSDFKRTLKV